MRSNPVGIHVCNLAIQASSVLSLTLLFPLVDIAILPSLYYCVNLCIVAVSREMAGKQLKDIQIVLCL